MVTEPVDSAQAKLKRLLREPTLHFFAVAALALAGQKLLTGDARTIELSRALEADLLRRYEDQLNRPPTRAEAEAFIAGWKDDEALYREALHEGLDRDDPTVRNVLIAKLRDRLLLQARIPEPTDAELARYLAQHRSDYEEPQIYEHEYVVLPKATTGAAPDADKYLRELEAGATPASLGLRSTAANVSRERIAQDLGPALAEEIPRLSPGKWQKLDAGERWVLVKLSRVQGGLPEPEALRERLAAGWKSERAREALARATHDIRERYRFEEAPR